MSDKYTPAPTNLLHVISARGQMPLPEFYAALDALLPTDPATRQLLESRTYRYLNTQVAGFLDALGHCELHYPNRTLAVCPPTLALLPTPGLPRVLLTGARDTDLERSLRQWVEAPERRGALSLTSLPQPDPILPLPAALVIEAVQLETLHEMARKLGLQFDGSSPVAWRLLHFSASLPQMRQRWTESAKPRADFDWSKRAFDAPSRSFRAVRPPTRGADADETPPAGLLEYTERRTQRRKHWLWYPDGTAAEVERNWARYGVLASLPGRDGDVLHYDARFHLLAVPDTVPLPTVLARAITLCSGLIPHKALLRGAPHLLYQAVSPLINKNLAEKLGQTPFSTGLHSLLPPFRK